MSKPKVLYDGWPLAYAPNSPAALHLLTLLEVLGDHIDAVLGLPALPPDWVQKGLKAEIQTFSNSPYSRLRWEQSWLPKQAAKMKAVLHTFSPSSALLPPGRLIASPSGFGKEDFSVQGLMERARLAVGSGGLARATALLWPEDLPPNREYDNLALTPPIVHPAFIPAEEFYPPEIPGLDLPETYILYHGPQSFSALRNLLETWTWVASSIGEFYPLLILGLAPAARGYVEYLRSDFGLEDSVRIMPPDLPLDWLVIVYQYCTALFQPSEPALWGSPVRHALACGRPVVSVDGPQMDALVGPAAFFLDSDQPKVLGAGLISIVVKDEIGEGLQAAALERAKPWRETAGYVDRLLEIYQSD